MVEPGRMMYGVPYGARARMILLYLQGQAIRSKSREVELGRSLSAWMSRMGIVWGGETARAIRDQAARISACSLKFFWEDDDVEGWSAGRIVNSGLRFSNALGDAQGALWEERVVLDEVFFLAWNGRGLADKDPFSVWGLTDKPGLSNEPWRDWRPGRVQHEYRLYRHLHFETTAQSCFDVGGADIVLHRHSAISS